MELSLKEIQEESLKLLIEFDEISRKNKLNYFLAYGTLIGAIRHRGFIPWDDDVDIWMPRKDINKLNEFFIQNSSKLYPLKLVNRENTLNYEYAIPRLVNNSFKYKSNIKEQKEVDMGIFIDIYPIDNYGNDGKTAKRIYKYINKKNREYRIYVNDVSYTNRYRTLFKKIYSKYLYLKFGKNFKYKIDDMIYKYISKNTSDDDIYIGVPIWESYGIQQFDRILFSNSMDIVFEGHIFKIPVEYHKILSLIYGDYMKFPEKDKQKPHHNYKIYTRD